MRPLLAALASALLFACSVWAAHVNVYWNVTYIDTDRTGDSPRRSITVNGAYPIPPIHVHLGDTLYIHLHNMLDAPTSIHGHGLLMNGTNYMDGAGMVTQCGIPPGESFTYKYDIVQRGTFWIHGHYDHQNSDGLRAPLIVHDERKYDGEFLFFLEDWYKQSYHERLRLTTGPGTVFPPPASFPHALINGFDGNKTKPIRFEKGKTYRIRLINMAITEWFKFSITGHKLRVIEVDSEYSDPLEVDGVDIGPAQRYSVLVTAHDDDEFNFNYNVTLYASFVPVVQGMNPRYYKGLVEYRKDAPLKKVPEPKNFVWADDLNLSAYSGQEPLPVTRQIDLSLNGSPFTNGKVLDVINNITYSEPKMPTLYSALSLGKLAFNESLYGPQTHAIVLNHMEYVELVLRNPNSLPHPIHLHGHVFQIVSSGPEELTPSLGFSETSNENTKEPVKTYTGRVPISRDTVVIPSGRYVKIRFRADNPGAWLLHCHMDIHMGMGMVMTFIEAPDVLQKTLRIPPQMADFCRKLNIPVEGNGAGKQGFDLSGLPEPPKMGLPPS
ncbi:ferroxidase fet3 [Coemansia sp. RSA 1722]|nr:ferroxidase fet3 [Coemansia sp. RSA 486]KAJ2237432.1 ferroxidase fet3 [Coemansia sp. RSA 485]KAJ2595290.1 ferroxidase fet3 [Coemansia sp. RSA 1722]KAJ2595323.1 ferroxidase fet3 [Coemansia sp. RSA 1721]